MWKEFIGIYFPFLIALVAIAIMTPALFIYPNDLHYGGTFEKYIQQESYGWSIVISAVACLAPALDITLDLFSALFVKHKIFTTLTTRIWLIVGNVLFALLRLELVYYRGSIVGFFILNYMQSTVLMSANLHYISTHCKVVFTQRRTVTIMTAWCLGFVLRSYALKYPYYTNPLAGVSSLLIFLSTVYCLVLILYHWVQEWRGRMNSRSSIGYEILFVLSCVASLTINWLDTDSDIEDGTRTIVHMTGHSGTFLTILIYVGVTHEFKWVSGLSHKSFFRFCFISQYHHMYTGLRIHVCHPLHKGYVREVRQ